MTRAPILTSVNRILLILFALLLAAATALVAHDLIQVARGCPAGDEGCILRLQHYRMSIPMGAWVAFLWAVVVAWGTLSRRIAASGRGAGWLAIFWLLPLIVGVYAAELLFG